jgi:hypothetical protein
LQAASSSGSLCAACVLLGHKVLLKTEHPERGKKSECPFKGADKDKATAEAEGRALMGWGPAKKWDTKEYIKRRLEVEAKEEGKGRQPENKLTFSAGGRERMGL